MVTLLKQYPGVLRVVLFGSVARGETRAHSDLDLIIVQQTSRRFMDRLDEFYRLLDPRVATDILVYTPAEWETLLAERPFIRLAVREGKVLYATEAA